MKLDLLFLSDLAVNQKDIEKGKLHLFYSPEKETELQEIRGGLNNVPPIMVKGDLNLFTYLPGMNVPFIEGVRTEAKTVLKQQKMQNYMRQLFDPSNPLHSNTTAKSILPKSLSNSFSNEI